MSDNKPRGFWKILKSIFCKHNKHSLHSVCPVIENGKVQNYKREKVCVNCGRKTDMGFVERELQERFPNMYNYKIPSSVLKFSMGRLA